MNSVSQTDLQHIWHPLTLQPQLKPNIEITKALGLWLYDNEGKKYIDAISSWYTAVYGHCHPKITAVVAEQMQRFDQVVFSGFTHRPAVALAKKLLELLPSNQNKVFFSDNGSTAVEVAIKMALQYHKNRGKKRNVLISFEEGFHGDTLAAMSVSGISVYNAPFTDFFMEVRRLPLPTGANNMQVLQLLEEMIAQKEVAAFIYEPLVLGAAGMKMYDRNGLEMLLRCCKKNEVITIADEVMTGFGKTGTIFASECLKTEPDIICLSKALSAGMLPLAVTSCSESIYGAFKSGSQEKAFFHAHTYTANPLACSAALAGIKLLESKEIQKAIKKIGIRHQEFVNRIQNHPYIYNCRALGVILAFDLKITTNRYGKFRDTVYEFFMQHEIYLRPLGNTIYIVPPYIIKDEELEYLYATMEQAIAYFFTRKNFILTP